MSNEQNQKSYGKYETFTLKKESKNLIHTVSERDTVNNQQAQPSSQTNDLSNSNIQGDE